MKKFLVCILFLALGSCTLFDSFDALPMFFRIDEVQLTTTVAQGYNTHKIQDVSVYADGFSIGVYNLPTSIPVLKTKEKLDLSIFAVIRNNGIASNPIEYPFYDKLSYEFDFVEEKSIALDLNFKYSSAVQIEQIADFEIANSFTVNFDNNDQLEFVRSSDTPYGDFCGKITLTESESFFEKASFLSIKRSTVSGSPVYLEMDYKSDMPFGLGILRKETGVGFVPFYKIILNEKEEWNKIYLELTAELNDPQVEEFNILIGSAANTTSTGSLFIDNVRIVHF